MPGDNLFYLIMEAGEDEIPMEPFDDGGATTDAPPEDIAPPATETGGDNANLDDGPPPIDDTGGLDMPSMDESGGGDAMGDNDTSTGENNDDADKKDEKLSDKANNILNDQLFKKMVDRNNEIEKIIGDIKQLIPLLPMDVVKANDESLNNLKSALGRGQKYVINDFVDAGYGENLLFYNKLDGLYVMLLNQIDNNLKKIENK